MPVEVSGLTVADCDTPRISWLGTSGRSSDHLACKCNASDAGDAGDSERVPTTTQSGDDPEDARDNILAGIAYLSELHNRYGSHGLLAAYHSGPEPYEAYRLEGRDRCRRRRSNTLNLQV